MEIGDKIRVKNSVVCRDIQNAWCRQADGVYECLQSMGNTEGYIKNIKKHSNGHVYLQIDHYTGEVRSDCVVIIQHINNTITEESEYEIY